MATLTLERAGVVIDLDALLKTPQGAQAVAGITGFGLPPVSVQWSEGAGDGATYRGRRVLPRDIDLPISYVAPSRTALRSLVRNLAIVLDGEATLRLTEDDGSSQTVAVYRTGGGDWVQGEDTDGKRFLKTVVTLRAGSPFWVTSTKVEADYPFGSPVAINNPGTADALPVWEIKGPTLGFTLTGPKGDRLSFPEFIPRGKKIVVDTNTGAVTDETGASRYSGLAAAPRFPTIPPGPSTATLTFDQSSADYTAIVTAGRRNLIKSPDGRSTTGWALGPNWSLFNATLRHGASGSATLTEDHSASYAFTGLTAGQSYTFGWDFSFKFSPNWFRTLFVTDPTWVVSSTTSWPDLQMVVTHSDGTTSTYKKTGVAEQTISGQWTETIVAKGSTLTVKITPPRQQLNFTNGLSRMGHADVSGDNFYFGLPGVPFTGDTPDTADYDYQWAGTAGASESLEAPKAAADKTGSGLHLSYNPRDWMEL